MSHLAYLYNQFPSCNTKLLYNSIVFNITKLLIALYYLQYEKHLFTIAAQRNIKVKTNKNYNAISVVKIFN